MVKGTMDGGHGGKDPGALGNGLKEKDITLAMSKKVGAILQEHGVVINYTRTTDKFLTLTERAMVANNAAADFFVSFHVNSATNPNARGFELFTTKGTTKADELAEYIALEIIKAFPDVPFRADKTDGDLDKEENFTVITKTKMPAVLVEMGFIVNSIDAQMLRTQQDKIATAIAKGILKYLGIAYKEDGIKISINGKTYVMEGVFENNKNYVGVRELSEALGYRVDWDAVNKVVKIYG